MGCCKPLNCLDLEELEYKTFCCCQCRTYKAEPGPFCVRRGNFKVEGWGVQVCCSNFITLAVRGVLGEEAKQTVLGEMYATEAEILSRPHLKDEFREDSQV